jgi:hypothetical protein
MAPGLVSVRKVHFLFQFFVCDINPPYLIPAARLAQRFYSGAANR